MAETTSPRGHAIFHHCLPMDTRNYRGVGRHVSLLVPARRSPQQAVASASNPLWPFARSNSQTLPAAEAPREACWRHRHGSFAEPQAPFPLHIGGPLQASRKPSEGIAACGTQESTRLGVAQM